MVMPFVRKSLSVLSVDSITEEQTTPMVSTLFPTEDLEGYNHTLSFKVELDVLIRSCHQTNVTQNWEILLLECLLHILASIYESQIYTITLVRHLNVQHVGGGQTSRGTKYNQ
jgi:hypothetical protein